MEDSLPLFAERVHEFAAVLHNLQHDGGCVLVILEVPCRLEEEGRERREGEKGGREGRERREGEKGREVKARGKV